MCGISTAKFKNEDVTLFIGYRPGSISIGENSYKYGDPESRRMDMLMGLSKFSSNDLAGLILDLVDNGDEA